MIDQTNIRISHDDPSFGTEPSKQFPWVRYDSGATICEEALIDGQYLGAHWSAMGRPSSRQRVWDELSPVTVHPNRSRQHAFQLQVDGHLLIDRWEWVSGEEIASARSGCREAVVKLRHTLRPVSVEVHTRLDGSPILARWLVVTNTSADRPAVISQADPWSGLLFDRLDFQDHGPIHFEQPFEVGRYLSNDWGREGEFAIEPLALGGLVIDSRAGSSGHRPPFFMARDRTSGEVVLGSLAYSGNWRLELIYDERFNKTSNRRVLMYFRFGISGIAPIRVLAPGESVTTPEVHLGMMHGDLDACTQAWHAHLRASVIPPQPEGRRHLIECNHTGYTLNAQMNEEGFIAEVETAATIGCELFMVDAGWFGDRTRAWGELMGDWTEGELLPRGLTPIFDRCRKLGMRCGLWLAAEYVSPTSKAAAAHPDWILRRRGKALDVWDLSRADTARHVEETIARFVERYSLDVYRIDIGTIRAADGGDIVRDDNLAEWTSWRYYDGLNGVIDRLRARFPNLVLENCLGGGARNNLDILSRFHFTQLSDAWSPGPAIKILNGATFFLAPEQCLTLLGAIARGVSDLDFMLRIGLFNGFCMSGAFPSMATKNDWGLERWQKTVELYKQFVRPMLATCRVFHHTPFQRHNQPGDWIVIEHASADARRAYAGIWRLTGGTDEAFTFIPRGLRREGSYRVTLHNNGETFTISGRELIDGGGLRVRVPGRMTSELLTFESPETP